MPFLEEIRFDAKGLVPAIVQDARSGRVLMLGYQNREAIERTVVTGEMHFFSRSRGRLWKKGESSGHVQRVKEVFVDCDGDALLYRAEQERAACHEGYFSCFFRKVNEEGDLVVTEERVFEPKDVYDD